METLLRKDGKSKDLEVVSSPEGQDLASPLDGSGFSVSDTAGKRSSVELCTASNRSLWGARSEGDFVRL